MEKKKSYIAYLVLFSFPFVFFSPLSSGFLAMGNDFDQVYFAYKKYIFEFYQEGEVPFWSPSEGSGYSLVFNPFAQFFFPFSWILYWILDFFNIFSLQIYLLYTIFFVSLFSIFQFQWLKSFKIFKKDNVYLVSLLAPCCLILSNFLRFPNAIMTIAWLPLLLLGINYSCNQKKNIKSFFLIFISSFCMFTAGYPYIVIYFFIFCFFYSLFIYFFFQVKKSFFKYILNIIIPVVFVLLIVSPWLYGVLKSLSITQDRNVANFIYATSHLFLIKDYIASLVYPIASNTEGRFFFGTFVTFLILYFLFTQQKKKIINKKILFLLYFIIVISFLTIILGSANNIFFDFLWKKISIIQNLRTWPRINILFIPILSLILALSLELINNKNYEFNDKKLIYSIILIIFFIQIYFYLNDIKDIYWYQWHEKRYIFAQNYFKGIISYIFEANKGLLNLLISITILLFLRFIFFQKKIKKNNKIIFLYSFLFVSVFFEQFINSNIQWSLKKWNTTYTEVPYINANQKFIKNFLKERNYKRVYGNHYFMDNEFSINMYWNWGNIYHNQIFWTYFRDFRGIFNEKKYNKDKQKIFLFFGLQYPVKKIFFSESLFANNVPNFVDHSLNFEKKNNCTYRFIKISNNEIILKFQCNNDGYISYIDNHDFFWKASLNNQNVEIKKLMNAYKSIKFKKGQNILKFSYYPFQFILEKVLN